MMKQTPRWIALATVLSIAGRAAAQAVSETAEAAFRRSLQENIDRSVDPRKFVAFAAAVVALILAAIVVTRWRGARQPAGRSANLNSPSKLLKEICKSTSLKSAEIRQLRILSDQQAVQSPLVLMLCPSVLQIALQQNVKRIDRQVLGTLAKKIVRS